jgi:hypothetical protein
VPRIKRPRVSTCSRRHSEKTQASVVEVRLDRPYVMAA